MCLAVGYSLPTCPQATEAVQVSFPATVVLDGLILPADAVLNDPGFDVAVRPRTGSELPSEHLKRVQNASLRLPGLLMLN